MPDFQIIMLKKGGQAKQYLSLINSCTFFCITQDHCQPGFLLAWIGQHIPNLCISDTKLCPSHYISDGSHIQASP